MTSRKAAAVIAGLLLLLGLVLGFTSVSVGQVDCGSALAPNTINAVAAEYGDALTDAYSGMTTIGNTDYQSQCESGLSTRRIVALVPGVIGALGLAFLALTANREAREAASSAP